ncbi:ExbD/TolR family protein [Thalassoroseus pseudoceratinae]|uniref:ExbD/TolR family protein n=1 Tax=Thalassoroseus pseudoceratinae TaxID=2713176 RepID=UPI0014208EF1|nr:biopolymer transporter ExbD [Thalassoroseus pseudoceratinae]
MRIRRRNKLLVESPASATGDIAFNLIVFFLVCASVQPEGGKEQNIPGSETVEQQNEQENLEVRIKRTVLLYNGDPIQPETLRPALTNKFSAARTPEEKLVVVSYDNDAPWSRYVEVSEIIDTAGGTVVLQTEEEKEVDIPAE